MKRQEENRGRFSRTALWRDCLGAPFARGDMVQDVLNGMSDLPSYIKVRLNPRTGLAQWLQGDDNLMPGEMAESDEGMLNLAFQFLNQFARPLLGREYDSEMFTTELLLGQRVRFRQVLFHSDYGRIPVYGASLLFGFNKGRLTWVNNSCYMLSPDLILPSEIEYPSFTELPAEVINPIIQEHVFYTLPPDIREGIIMPGVIQSLQETLELFEMEMDMRQQYTLSRVSCALLNHSVFKPPVGYTNTPVSLTAAQPPIPRPPKFKDDVPGRLHTTLFEQFKMSVPEKAHDKLPTVIDTFMEKQLDINPAQAALNISAHTLYEGGRVIFPLLDSKGQPDYHPAWSAISYEEKMGVEWEVIVSQRDGAYEILASGDFTAGLFNLVQEVGNGNLIPVSQPDLRNELIHDTLANALSLFKNLGNHPGLNDIKMPGDQGSLNIVIDAASTQYISNGHDTAGPRIEIGESDGESEIGDPAEDPQVLYHEYTHAVVDVVQSDFYNANLTSPFNDPMNEGFAFYYGCALHDRQNNPQHPNQWGAIAYQTQKWLDFHNLAPNLLPSQYRSGYDSLDAFHVFPHYAGGCDYPLDDEADCQLYACGILWARALWDVRTIVGDDADYIILKALRLCNGPQDMRTTAEAILHELEEAGQSTQILNDVRQQFINRRIIPPAPIYDLATFTLNGSRYVLAATARIDGGCFISSTQNWGWQVLGGNSCPENVVALTILDVSSNEKWVFIAVEVQDNGIKTQFHFCKLTGNGNSYQIAQNWQEIGTNSLPELSTRSVFSLAVIQTNNNGFRLFAGTEHGLYWCDDDVTTIAPWQHINYSSVPILPPPTPLFQVNILSDLQPPQLVVSGLGVLRTVSPNDPNTTIPVGESELGPKYVLAGLPHDGSWHIGLGHGGLQKFNNVQNNWTGYNPTGLTVYKLLSGANGELYAGTSDGVYSLENGVLQPLLYNGIFGQIHLFAEQPVLSLCSWGEDNLLATTVWGEIKHYDGNTAVSRPL